MSDLEKYFEQFRKDIIGIDAEFESPYGKQKMIYADWIASGRLYSPIEDIMRNNFGPMIGNTHSEASETGVTMTLAYHQAHKIIKKHVNADENDVILTTGSGMTGVVNKMQRILGLKMPEQLRKCCESKLKEEDKPVVFITHMEHHSNQTSWLETLTDVVIIEPDENLSTSPENLRKELEKYKTRKFKFGSFSGGSNVTGLTPDYYKLAEIMHEFGGWTFVDFAASAPYVNINMHPENKNQRLDAIFFSPHKALGGPGSSGVMIFNKELYKNNIPDQPGGGTVVWTNRWNEYAYVCDIEAREDGGTPAFLQTIRAALALRLKEKMGVEKIAAREHELLEITFREFEKIPKLHLLAANQKDRFGVISFYIEGVHHNLIVKLLNDRFGIQMRGGCSCAGTYGHFLLHVNKKDSDRITDKINQGDLTEKPGWVRMSIHQTMSNNELFFIINAINQIVENIENWKADYNFDKTSGEFFNKNITRRKSEDFTNWFEL